MFGPNGINQNLTNSWRRGKRITGEEVVRVEKKNNISTGYYPKNHNNKNNDNDNDNYNNNYCSFEIIIIIIIIILKDKHKDVLWNTHQFAFLGGGNLAVIFVSSSLVAQQFVRLPDIQKDKCNMEQQNALLIVVIKRGIGPSPWYLSF